MHLLTVLDRLNDFMLVNMLKKQKHFYCSALKCILLGCFLSIDTITGISESS